MITIRHDVDGTSADGTTRGDDAGQILKRVGGFMWSRNAGAWVLNRTWKVGTREWKVNATVAALEAAGIPVTVERGDVAPAVTTTVEDVAARETADAERVAARVERREDYAARQAATADAGFARARAMSDRIPFGQPILVGHHSEGRDRNFRARIGRTEDRALEAHNAAQDAARLAATAAAGLRHRESLPATLRRLERLAAERRDVQRKLDGTGSHGVRYMDDGTVRHNVGASGEWRVRLDARAVELDAEIAYWQGHVAELQAAGARVWTRDDFKPGDYALCRGRWYRVVKANPKTLHLEVGMARALPYGYADVTGHRAAADIPATV